MNTAFSNTRKDRYRFTFQGQEGDSEVKGEGNSYTTEFRQLDPRLGRWLSIDPMSEKFPHQSPYAAFDNNPLNIIDPNGAEGREPQEPVDESRAHIKYHYSTQVVDGRTVYLKKYTYHNVRLNLKTKYDIQNSVDQGYGSGWTPIDRKTYQNDARRQYRYAFDPNRIVVGARNHEGTGPSTRNFSVQGASSGTLTVSYTTYDIPDRIQVFDADGNSLFDTTVPVQTYTDTETSGEKTFTSTDGDFNFTLTVSGAPELGDEMGEASRYNISITVQSDAEETYSSPSETIP